MNEYREHNLAGESILDNVSQRGNLAASQILKKFPKDPKIDASDSVAGKVSTTPGRFKSMKMLTRGPRQNTHHRELFIDSYRNNQVYVLLVELFRQKQSHRENSSNW